MYQIAMNFTIAHQISESYKISPYLTDLSLEDVGFFEKKPSYIVGFVVHNKKHTLRSDSAISFMCCACHSIV